MTDPARTRQQTSSDGAAALSRDVLDADQFDPLDPKPGIYRNVIDTDYIPAVWPPMWCSEIPGANSASPS